MQIRERALCFVAAVCLSMPASADSSTMQKTGNESGLRPPDRQFAAALDDHLDAALGDGKLDNIHAVVVIRNGRLVFERYFAGEDERWGRPLGRVRFDASTLHDLRSVSKSVVGLLYGIALAEGKVPALQEAILEHLGRDTDPPAGPVRRIEVEDVLTMRLGLAWNENLPYTDPRNSEHAMELADDRCGYVLAQPAVEEPGTTWRYSGGATALLACLLTTGTGMRLEDYARSRLFEPLSIEEFEWVTGSDGVAAAASGLRMRPRDLAKLGRVGLAGGRHEGRQLVPADWLEASFKPHVRTDSELHYGYHWWVAPQWSWVAAFGNGGQRLTIMPRHELVLVVTAGNYNKPDAWRVPVAVHVDALLPALVD